MLKTRHVETHRAYLSSYGTTAFNPVEVVAFDFADGRGGRLVLDFLALPGTEQKPSGRAVSSPTTSAATTPASNSERPKWASTAQAP
jgi:hypothetical protein